jgi:hypothetical protein
MTPPDGRTLAYTDCGDLEGPVLTHFHTAPTSRLYAWFGWPPET